MQANLQEDLFEFSQLMVVLLSGNALPLEEQEEHFGIALELIDACEAREADVPDTQVKLVESLGGFPKGRKLMEAARVQRDNARSTKEALASLEKACADFASSVLKVR